jgi:hypothetical protein
VLSQRLPTNRLRRRLTWAAQKQHRQAIRTNTDSKGSMRVHPMQRPGHGVDQPSGGSQPSSGRTVWQTPLDRWQSSQQLRRAAGYFGRCCGGDAGSQE